VGLKHFQNNGRREWWSFHVEACRRSGLVIRKSCRQQRLTDDTFSRWLKRLLSATNLLLKLEKYQTGLRREQRREERKMGYESAVGNASASAPDVRNRGMQAFWEMHVETMNWSGMGVREYAAAMSLSPYASRKWRDQLADCEVEINSPGHLPARPLVLVLTAPLTSLTGNRLDRRCGCPSVLPTR
jgi:hypothetical protein